jgi:hypothetical protein
VPSINTHIEISLAEIAPDLLISMGERGYLSWSKGLTEEIRSSLSTIENEHLDLKVETKPLRGAATKGDILTIGLIGITLAGRFGASETAMKVAKALWAGLKKTFATNPKSTSVELDVETTTSSRGTIKRKRKLKVTADDAEAVKMLFDALNSQDEEGGNMRITPQKQ